MQTPSASGLGFQEVPLHAVVAAAGSAVSRFERFTDAAVAFDAKFVECTTVGMGLRLAIVTRGGAVVDHATSGSTSLAALGSSLWGMTDPAKDLLRAFERHGAAFLDGRPDDLAVIAAEGGVGRLVIGAGSGNHRVFVADLDDGLLASTHIGLLAAALGPDLEVDRSYEDFLLGFGFLPDGRTVYRRVTAHPAGTVRTWPAGASRTVDSSAGDALVRPNHRNAVIKALHDAFFATLEEQVGDHRRHAVLLGGLDSGLVAASLRRLGHEVDTYTFAFGDARYEQRNAELLADHIGARHTWIPFTPSTIGSLLEELPDVLSQPGPQPHYQLHTIHASRVIAEDGHTHIFTGDGCDAVFLGYPTVARRARLMSGVAGVPGSARRAALWIFERRAMERRLGHIARLARASLANADLPWPALGHLPSRLLDDHALQRLRLEPAPPQGESIEATQVRLAHGLDRLDRVRLAFHGHALTGQSKAKVEGAVATSGLPQISPYLHQRVRALGAALPADSLRPPGSSARAPGKAVLLDMVRTHDLLPDAIVDMPKQSPSDSPIDRWYQGPLRPLVFRLLEGLPFAYNRAYVEEILRPKMVEDLFRERVSLSHHAFQVIGLLCSYAAFTRRAR